MGARDTFWELKGSMSYSLGSGGSTLYSHGTGGEHMIQSGNWRVARDTVWGLEGCT